MLHRAARNAYSWWWASHIRTKQSKWLDQKLQDMEEKVEYILKIIEEDGDSFSQRAEMYYKKRPELVNFVEDSFRGYRALAERFDHLSKELQSANRTIASAYPEKVQLAMDKEDEEILCTAPFSDSKPPSKNFPAVPKLDIPKIIKIPQKSSKAPGRLMSKKGLLKMRGPTVIDAAATSGMSKAEAVREIDKLQKNILGLQTEKEFIKSSYESGVAKYWEIEEQVTEMQAKVNLLQDEFGIGRFIEDDEARMLMVATALKSCQEALIRLEEKQNLSDEEARIEYRRIQESHEKLRILKENFGKQTLELVSKSTELKDLDQKVESIGTKERNDLELFRKKIREQLQVNSSNESLTMSELVEKIDELVEKIITFETSVSSHNAQIKRLRRETDEFQGHLQSLEEDKEALIVGSNSKSNKIRELEQELLRIQNFNQNVENQNKHLQIRFTQASFSIDNLSEELLRVKQEYEEHEKIVQVEKAPAPANKSKISKANVRVVELVEARDDPNANPGFKGSEDVMALSYHSDIAKNEGNDLSIKAEESFAQPKLCSCLDDVLEVPLEVRDVPNANPEIKYKENQDAVKVGMEGEAKKYDYVSVKSAERFIQRELSFRLDDYFVEGEVNEGLNEGQEIMAPGCDDMVQKDVKMEEKGKKNGSLDLHTVIAGEENWFQFNPHYEHESLSVNGQVRTVLVMDSKGLNDPMISTVVQTETGERKNGNQDLRASVGIEEENIVRSISTNPFNDFLEEATDSIQPESQENHNVGSQELEINEDEDQPNWRELFLNGLGDREKILVEQYTLILRNYKETRKKLGEIEKENHESYFKSAVQIKELKNANDLKDAEIRSLHKKLNLWVHENPDTDLTREGEEGDKRVISDQNQVSDLLDELVVESLDRKCKEGEKRVIPVDKPHSVSMVEEKLRSDIDELLEENIEFWLRFSTSFHQIQKFQTSIEDLQEELTKQRESKKQEGSSSKSHSSVNSSDVLPIYTHLREIQTELALWLEHNSLLEDDLQNRLSSLLSIHKEISRVSNSGFKDEEETLLSNYQAAKFQGEVLNMKQENNQVGYKLQEGLHRVKELQSWIAKTLEDLEEEFGVKNKERKSSLSRSRIPLRSFLFGVRLRKQRPSSLFQCMSPALQKQYSDLGTLPT